MKGRTDPDMKGNEKIKLAVFFWQVLLAAKLAVLAIEFYIYIF